MANLIRGSVRQQGKRIRVSISMTRAADGVSICSQSYDDQLKEVFAIQSRINEAVASELKFKFSGKAIVASTQRQFTSASQQ